MSSVAVQSPVEGYRLSPHQNHLWRLRGSDADAFAVQCTAVLPAIPDERLLQAAIDRVVSNYEALRTTFTTLAETSVPVQTVSAASSISLEVVDRLGLGSSYHELERPRPVSVHAPVSFRLEYLPNGEALLTATAAALCADHWALVQVVREIECEYSGNRRDRESVIQLADFAEWQNQLVRNSDHDSPPYWNTAAFQDKAFPRLPFERRQTLSREFRAVPRDVSPESSRALEKIADSSGVSISAVLLAALEIVLHRFTGLDGFLLGVALEGRVHQELKDLIAPLAKSVPIPATIRPVENFPSLASDVASTLTLAESDLHRFDWQVFRETHPAADPGFCPILFSGSTIHAITPDNAGAWRILPAEVAHEPHDLAFLAGWNRESLSTACDANESRFTETDVAVLLDSYAAVLEAAACAPESTVAELGLRCVQSPSGLLAGSVATKPFKFKPLHSSIEEQVRRVPERPAIVSPSGQLTYRELNHRSAALSRLLTGAGAGRDSVVAIFADRSVDFAVAIFGVLKCGAAWLPIEPDIPQERIAYMLQAARASAVVTQRQLRPFLSFTSVPVICVDDPQPADDVRPDPNPAADVLPNQLAYIVFTSGSTGRPKGVAVEQRHMAAYLRGLHAETHLPDRARYALLSTFAADLGHTPLLAALTSGGCVHVLPGSLASDIERLADYFQQTPVDCVKIAPTHLDALCRAFPSGATLPWTCAIVGGEPLKWEVIAELHRLAPGCRVIDEYGPTETTVGVISASFDTASEPYATLEAPIGKPRPGVRAYVLDGQRQPVGSWVTGELYIGGETVARGYIGAPDLTADRFLPDPFSSIPGTRMYRTGDFARHRTDGALEFLGRRDRQVKVRGYRIELAEIEAAFCTHPDVRSAAAFVIEGAAGKQIAGWAAVGAAKLNALDLRHYLQRQLPTYLIPSHLVCSERLQITQNGKIDESAFIALAAKSHTSEDDYPVDDIEESLLAGWRRVLGRERIGVNDNYFSLGGDSLRVMQLVYEARRFGLQINATDVLRHQTVRKLRAALRNASARGNSGLERAEPAPAPMLAAHAPSAFVDFYPATPIQQFVIESYGRNTPNRRAFHIQDCFHIRDDRFSLSALIAAFRAVVDRHPALRTVFDFSVDPPMQCVRQQLPWTPDVRDVSHLGDSEKQTYIAETLNTDRSTPFDVRNPHAPLFRILVFTRGAHEFSVAFSCHHAIMDGWGHRVLLNQWLEAYTRIKSGSEVLLGSPDSSCKELALYLDGLRHSETAAEFWKQYMAGVDREPLLTGAPTHQIRGESSFLCEVSPSLYAALIRIAQQEAVSAQALLLSGWMNVMRRCGYARDHVVTGVVVNGRSEYLSDALGAVGLFWNMTPIVSRAAGPVIEQAHRLHRDLIAIHPQSGYPLTRIIPRADREYLFTSTFRYVNFWNTVRSAAEQAGLHLLGGNAYDMYPFPMNCSAALNSSESGGYLKLEYLQEAISAAQAKTVINEYYRVLEQTAAAGGQ